MRRPSEPRMILRCPHNLQTLCGDSMRDENQPPYTRERPIPVAPATMQKLEARDPASRHAIALTSLATHDLPDSLHRQTVVLREAGQTLARQILLLDLSVAPGLPRGPIGFWPTGKRLTRVQGLSECANRSLDT
jgi:hypothetical protein